MIKKINESYDFEQKLDYIIKLYEGEVDEKTIRILATLASSYGGTLLTKLILDLYDSIIYNDKPRGPTADIKNFFI